MDISNFKLNSNQKIPLYEQLANFFTLQICSQQIKNEQKLPSEKQLKESLNIGKATIRKAFDILENQNLIERYQGKGIFVKFNKIKRLSWGIGSFTDQVSRDNDVRSIVLTCVIEFQVNHKFLHLKSVRGIKNELNLKTTCLSIEDSYINADNLNGIENYDYSCNSLYFVLRHNFHVFPSTGQLELSTIAATEFESQYLEVKLGQSLIKVTQNVFDQ